MPTLCDITLQGREVPAMDSASQRATESLDYRDESELRIRSIFETALDAVVTMDPAGLISSWNAEAERLFGWSQEEVLGSRMSDTIIPPHHREAHERGVQRFLDTGEGPLLNKRIEITALHRSGREFPVELAVSCAKVADTWTFSAFIRDLSQRRQVEEAREAANRAKSESLALQETDRLQKALLNSVSHNLRTPLASVIGAINTVLEDGALLDAPTQQSLLKTAQEEAKKLDRLVQNLLDMTRLEGGAIRVRTELCDVHDVVGAALEQLGDATRGHAISTIFLPDMPLVPMDQVLIVQVLVNLLDNALKYSPGEATIQIEARLNSGQLEVRVLDRGMGISEQELERVFEKFYRGTPHGAARGAGLGLSICKGFVEAHNGRILAKCRAQGGTEVAFFLPVQPKQ
jgi:PAS domain S-box-containing protein